MKKYHSYKDSGVEWIGVIPNEWSVKRMCYLFVPTSIKSTEGEINLSVYRDYGVIPRDSRDDNHNVVSEDTSNYKLVEVGDFVMNKMKCWMGSLGLSNFRGIVSPSYTVMKPLTKDNSRFLHYLLRSPFYIPQYRRLSYGVRIGQWDLRFEDFRDLSCILPPLSEQSQIVTFLDTKTSLIDSLIQKTQRKIELLKEKRTSLINEVVTKGLNPNVEMKDSGGEWIGEIPSHYQIGKLKHLCNENQKSLSNSTDPNYELNYIEISDVNSEGVIGNSTQYIFSESPSRCRRIVQKGDVIVSTVRTYLKSIGLIEEEVEDLICSTGFSVLTPNIEINSKYLFYLLRTEWFISMVISKSEGVSYPSIQSEKLMNIDVVFCELSEQNEIVSYLDEHTQLIDKTISVEERRIDYLKEYRQSLISEVVTGKRKVVD